MSGGMGWTALHMAAANRHEELARVLIDLGAPVDARGSERETSLHLAIRKLGEGDSEAGGQASIVRLLLERGADPDLRDRDGMTARQAAEQAGHREIAELLAKSVEEAGER